MAGLDNPELSAMLIRVVIGNLYGALRQVVVDLIAQQPDMVLAGAADDPLQVLLAAAGVDVLVLGAAAVDPAPGLCSHLLSEFPHLRILVLAQTGDAAMLYWLGLQREEVAPVSSNSLLGEIRRAFQLNATVSDG